MDQEDAKKLIIREWDDWASSKLRPDEDGSGDHAYSFFLHVKRERPELLDFPATADKWQWVRAFLLQEGKTFD